MPDDSPANRRDDDLPGDAQRNPDAGLTDLIHRDRAANQPVAGNLRFDGDDRDDLEVEQGTDVLCADGEKIGEVVDITGDYLVVECGFFIPKDIYIPKDVIAADHDDDDVGVRLTLTKDQFEKRDWSEYPDDNDRKPDGSAR